MQRQPCCAPAHGTQCNDKHIALSFSSAPPYCSFAFLEKPGILSSCTAALVAGSAAAMACSTLRLSGRRVFWFSSSIALFSCGGTHKGHIDSAPSVAIWIGPTHLSGTLDCRLYHKSTWMSSQRLACGDKLARSPAVVRHGAAAATTTT